LFGFAVLLPSSTMGHLKLCVVHFASANRAIWLSGTNILMPNSQNSSYLLKNLFSGREHKCKPDVNGLERL
jgi:hypothetical protein